MVLEVVQRQLPLLKNINIFTFFPLSFFSGSAPQNGRIRIQILHRDRGELS